MIITGNFYIGELVRSPVLPDNPKGHGRLPRAQRLYTDRQVVVGRSDRAGAPQLGLVEAFFIAKKL